MHVYKWDLKDLNLALWMFFMKLNFLVKEYNAITKSFNNYVSVGQDFVQSL
jgi:hypothetical protein